MSFSSKIKRIQKIALKCFSPAKYLVINMQDNKRSCIKRIVTAYMLAIL